MKCKEAKDIILTDYIDHELDGSMNNELQAHIKSCEECRAFVQEVQNNLVQPFSTVEAEEPPQQIWNNIEDAIDAQRQRSGIWETIKNLVLRPRPVLAFNGALIMVILVSFFWTQNTQQNFVVNTSDDDIDVLAYVIDETDFELDKSSDFGTAIEAYFL